LKRGIISIVDDDQAIGESIKELLKSMALPAAVFTSGHAFLTSNDIAQTTCLISDVKMPGIGGVELQRILIEKGYHFPVIFISAFDSETVRKATAKSGAISFLTKPFSEEDLLGCIRSALAIEFSGNQNDPSRGKEVPE
jgi:FixJ family two-component response regulator